MIVRYKGEQDHRIVPCTGSKDIVNLWENCLKRSIKPVVTCIYEGEQDHRIVACMGSKGK